MGQGRQGAGEQVGFRRRAGADGYRCVPGLQPVLQQVNEAGHYPAVQAGGEDDVGAASGHIGCHGNGAGFAGGAHDVGFLRAGGGVEQPVGNAGGRQPAADDCRLRHGAGGYQRRTP